MPLATQSTHSLAGSSSTGSRLLLIDGLRAYLALWILAAHVCWLSGFEPEAFLSLPKIFKMLRTEPYLVQLFMIISGFVITLSLDTQRETYQQFIVRRFFRLFPVFLTLFIVAIPMSLVGLWNVTHASQYLTPLEIDNGATGITRVQSWWANIQWHIPLHLLMLHGIVPDILIKDAPGAFLLPAWMVSLEWQFYLVAPLAYGWAISSKPYRPLALCALCVVLMLAARYTFPSVEFGAALPFQVKFFFLGAASYFLYKRRSAQRVPDIVFPVACGLSLFLLVGSGPAWSLITISLWLAFLGVLLEPTSSLSSRLVSPLFTNPLVQYLGRISYSLYLSHMLVIIGVQYVLLAWAPQLSHSAHFLILLAGTTVVTIVLSTVLYRYLEVPGIHVGRALVRRFVARGDTGERKANVDPQEAKDYPRISWG